MYKSGCQDMGVQISEALLSKRQTRGMDMNPRKTF